jgi:hypothetical protein
LVVDTAEVIGRGGIEKSLISDYRMAPTPTPTATITPTPGPNMIQRLWSKVNPKESPTPSGTVTPEASESPTPAPSIVASPSVSPVVSPVQKKKKAILHKHAKSHKTVKTIHKAKLKAKKASTTVPALTITPTPNA